MAVSLSTAYAIGDVLSLRHSLHRKPKDAKVFYAVYGGLVAVAAALVLAPGTPLGLLTNAVQSLAGVLLPSATVFLLLLCNDKAVLGPWTNTNWVNLFTGAVIAVLIVLSVILTAAVLFPGLGEGAMIALLAGGGVGAIAVWMMAGGLRRRVPENAPGVDRALGASWRMPPLSELPPRRLTRAEQVWLVVLRGYLFVAAGLVLVRIVSLAIIGHN
jgi:hypothetical protein